MWILYWENELGKHGYFHAKGRKDPKLKHRIRLVYSLSEAKASGLAREDERYWQNVEKKCRDIRPYVSTFFFFTNLFLYHNYLSFYTIPLWVEQIEIIESVTCPAG
jgi:hypothetical protein